MRTIESSRFLPFEKDLLPVEALSKYAFSLCGGPCAGMFRIRDEKMLKELDDSCFSES